MTIIDPLEITVAPFGSLMVVAFAEVVGGVIVPPGVVVLFRSVPVPVVGKVVFVKVVEKVVLPDGGVVVVSFDPGGLEVVVFPNGGKEVVAFPEVPVCVINVVRSVMVFVTNPVVLMISVVVKLCVLVSVSVVV